MAVRPNQVTVGTSAVRLDAVENSTQTTGANSYSGASAQTVLVTVPSTVYVGGHEGVATSGDQRGFPLAAGTYTFQLRGDDALFGVVASSTAAVEVLQVGDRASGWGANYGPNWGG